MSQESRAKAEEARQAFETNAASAFDRERARSRCEHCMLPHGNNRDDREMGCSKSEMAMSSRKVRTTTVRLLSFLSNGNGQDASGRKASHRDFVDAKEKSGCRRGGDNGGETCPTRNLHHRRRQSRREGKSLVAKLGVEGIRAESRIDAIEGTKAQVKRKLRSHTSLVRKQRLVWCALASQLLFLSLMESWRACSSPSGDLVLFNPTWQDLHRHSDKKAFCEPLQSHVPC